MSGRGRNEKIGEEECAGEGTPLSEFLGGTPTVPWGSPDGIARLGAGAAAGEGVAPPQAPAAELRAEVPAAAPKTKTRTRARART